MVFGFRHAKWYGLRRMGLKANDQWGLDVIAVKGAFDPPMKRDFYDEKLTPDPTDQVVELKLVIKKVLE